MAGGEGCLLPGIVHGFGSLLVVEVRKRVGVLIRRNFLSQKAGILVSSPWLVCPVPFLDEIRDKRFAKEGMMEELELRWQ